MAQAHGQQMAQMARGWHTDGTEVAQMGLRLRAWDQAEKLAVLALLPG